jgi:hypothetical protein
MIDPQPVTTFPGISLDNPGVDFVILDTSVMVEENSARPRASALGGLFLFRAESRQP